MVDQAQPRSGDPRSSRSFALYSLVVLAYNLGVVLWGAYVRATGSGAGCGAHWPLCNGELVPTSPSAARVIEFSHRVSSGLTLLLVLIMVAWAFRRYARGSSVRKGAILSLIFTFTEALVGAGLVLFQLVATNTSFARTISISIHLTNTFLLLGALTLTSFWASGGGSIQWSRRRVTDSLDVLGIAGLLIVGVTGAVTALGDTLFPVNTLAEGLSQDFSSTAEFLVRLRVVHPLAAVVVGIYIVLFIRGVTVYQTANLWRVGAITTALVAAQWFVGLMNVYLLAPVLVQIVHLLFADLLWIAFVWFSAILLSQAPDARKTIELKQIFHGILGSDVN